MIPFVADINLSGRGMNCDSRQERRWGIGVGLHGQELACMTVGVRESVDLAGIAARDENAPAILAERKPVPSLGKRQKLRHLPAGNIQQCQAGVAEPATHGHDGLFVRRNYQLERQIANQHRSAGGSDAQAIEEQVYIWPETWQATDG